MVEGKIKGRMNPSLWNLEKVLETPKSLWLLNSTLYLERRKEADEILKQE